MYYGRRGLLPSLFLGALLNNPSLWAQVTTPSSGSNAARLDARAQWEPSPAAVQRARMSCPNLSFPALGECFARSMQRYGASPEAVAFTHSIANEGYLHVFVPAGRVDIAFVTYPFRANENEGCLLVNATPPDTSTGRPGAVVRGSMIDIDNLRDLPQTAMRRDRAYLALAASYPSVSLWPGDRTDRRTVIAGTTPGGGQRFLAEYLLLNGCHACARIAFARFAFDFDADGKLSEIKFIEVRPAKPN
jgi:hypothetical protein